MREINIVLVHQALWGQNAKKATNIFSVASSRSITWKIGTVCPFLVHSWTSQNMPTITKRGVYSPVIISIRIPISARAGAQLASGAGADAACLLCLSSLTSVNVTGCSPRANRHRVRGLMRAEIVRRDRGSDCSAHIHAARLFDECGETLRRTRETPPPRLLPHRDQRG